MSDTQTPPTAIFTQGIEHSTTLAALGKALATAQASFTHPSKSRMVDVGQYRYAYAELPIVIDAVRPALSANGLCLLQPVEVRGTDVRIWTMLLHTSGEWLRSALVLQAESPKAQAVGSAITYGRRYGLSAMLGIAADEDEDGALAGLRPLSKPAPVTSGGGISVIDVKQREQKKRDGSGTFTIYEVAFSDERIAETFKDSIAKDARLAYDLGCEVTRTLEEASNPKYYPKLTGLTLIEPDAPPSEREPGEDDLPL